MSLNNEVKQCWLEIEDLERELAELERRRPDPTLDKINEAFTVSVRRGADMAGLPAGWNEGYDNEWFRTPYEFKHLSHTAVPAKSFEDAVKEFAKCGHHVTRSNVEMWSGDRWCNEAELT